MRGPIDDYVAALQQELQGPWPARRSIVQELRDGLADATEAYRGSGVPKTDAERQAVADLGDPSDVAAAFREELAAHTGRQTAWLLLVLTAATFAAATLAWRGDSAHVATFRPPTAYSVLAQAVDLLAAATVIGGVVAVAAFGWATKWIGSAFRATRTVGWLVLITTGAKMLGGTILWLWTPGAHRMTTASFAVAALILVTTAWLALSAARCVSIGSACRA